MTYLYLVIAILFIAYIVDNQKNSRDTVSIRLSDGLIKFLLFIICIILIMFSACRNGYNDTTTYISWYYSMNNLYSVTNDFSIGSEALFMIAMYCMNTLGFSHNVFFAVNAAIFVIPAIIFIYRYSKTFFLSMVVFMATCYLFGLAGMRQQTATGFLMIAYMCYENKKKLLAVIIFVIAQYTHAYSFIFLALFLVYKLKLWDKGMAFYLVACTGLMAVLPSFAGIIQSISDILGTDYGEGLFTGESVTILRFLVCFYPIIASILWKKNLVTTFDESDTRYFNIAMISPFTLMFALVALPYIFGRLGSFFAVFYCVGVGNMLKVILKEEDGAIKFFVHVLAVALYIIYVLYDIYTHSSNFANPFGF
ncbi:MAG: EpsG family protein [Bacillota bacterium]